MPIRVETFERIEEAAQALSANQSARFFGGGTLLMRGVNSGDQRFDTLIRVTDPAFREIQIQGDRITLGGGVTMAQILAHRDLAFLAGPARAVGGPAVRNAATVGGNLNVGSPFGDFTTALLALGAEVQLSSQGGNSVSIDDFLRDRSSARQSIVSAVSLKRPQDQSSFRFLKVSRVKPKGISLLSMAASISRSPAGVRVAYGNMGPGPVRATAVERALEGASLDASGIAPALAVAAEGLTPPTDPLATDWYRREVAPVHLKRLLLGAA
ncbi:MAG: FAD binding domain-containing protein [Hyphomicrobiales bacterium]